MRRPTIPDLAKAAGVSVATVNRVLSGAPNVRLETRERVQIAAEAISFYASGSIRVRVAEARPRLRLGVLLLQPHRPFYQNLAQALTTAAAQTSGAEIDLCIEYQEDLSPQVAASRALALAERSQAIGIVAAVHPVVTEAVAQVQARGVPVLALVAPFSSVPYVGIDNWKLGRTGAWAFHHLCPWPGKIGMLVGHPRFRNQEISEASFRSYFRECAPDFSVLEPLSTFESADVAQDMAERLLTDHPDLAGLWVNGGGVTGAIAAVQARGLSGKLVVVGHDLTPVTRAALLDGTMTLLMSHQLDRFAGAAIAALVGACTDPAGIRTEITPFEVLTRENL